MLAVGLATAWYLIIHRVRFRTVFSRASPAWRGRGRGVNEQILVVDDEPIVTEVVAKYLVREGFRVTVVRDGQAALAAAQAESPDLIVLDLMLPEIDGLDVCRRVRASSRVPIIMLTAKDEGSGQILRLRLGAAGSV